MTFDEIVNCLSLEDKKVIREMMTLLDDISLQTKEFSAQTGLKCKQGCGACCSTPNIETTVAEVMPLAVYLWSEDQAQRIFDSLRSNAQSRTCVFYEHDPRDTAKGRCSIYAYRPGLCRLFGFSAHLDKYGKLMLSTCKVIKEAQADTCSQTQTKLQEGLKAPLLKSHSFAVANIDPIRGNALRPINEAVSQALEKIGYLIAQNADKLKQ